MRRWCVVPFPSEAIKSTLITPQIENLLVIKELPPQSQKHQKEVVTLTTVKNTDTRLTWIELLVYLYWLPWTSSHCLHFWLWVVVCLLSFYCMGCLKIKEVQSLQFTRFATSNNITYIMSLCGATKLTTTLGEWLVPQWYHAEL